MSTVLWLLQIGICFENHLQGCVIHFPAMELPPGNGGTAERQEDENRNLLGADAAAARSRQQQSMLEVDAEAVRIGGQEALRQH